MKEGRDFNSGDSVYLLSTKCPFIPPKHTSKNHLLTVLLTYRSLMAKMEGSTQIELKTKINSWHEKSVCRKSLSPASDVLLGELSLLFISPFPGMVVVMVEVANCWCSWLRVKPPHTDFWRKRSVIFFIFFFFLNFVLKVGVCNFKERY